MTEITKDHMATAGNVERFNVPGQPLLARFTFTCDERDRKGKKTWKGTITLLESDLRRIGGEVYCNVMRRSEAQRRDSHFGSDARSVRETPAISEPMSSPVASALPLAGGGGADRGSGTGAGGDDVAASRRIWGFGMELGTVAGASTRLPPRS
jgi:hypothetical protein